MSGDNDDAGSIGLLTNEDIRTGFIRKIKGGKYKAVQYSAVDGMAVLEGCMVLGTVEEMETLAEELRKHTEGTLESHGVAITGKRFRWKNKQVPFRIDAGLPHPERVTKAIAHWEAKTELRFPARKPTDRNFITFRRGDGCSSRVGMVGGEQFITMADECQVGNIIHEIGHAIGLFHEQSREDRDRFVKVRFENIKQAAIHNFNQQITDGDDIGGYDFASIMHYPKNAFSKNGLPTIEPVGNKPIGQRTGLSAGDIAAVKALYP